MPITVRGRATDTAGKPVAGATIYLVSTFGVDAAAGTTTTAVDGSYTFRDAPLPVFHRNLILKAPRQVAVRVVYADTGKPAPNVYFGASGDGNEAWGQSDSEGKLVLKLPLGAYSGLAYPRDKSIVYTRTRTQFTVAAEPAEQSLEVRLAPADCSSCSREIGKASRRDS